MTSAHPVPGPPPTGAPIPGAPPVGADGPADAPAVPSGPPPVRPASPWTELRRDLRWAIGVVVVLALVGLPLGALWWGIAPRADFRITAGGPVVIGNPSDELLVGDDVLFVLIMSGFGVLAGAAGWIAARRRGLATLLALAVGTLAGAVLAWQLGELLGPPPTRAALAHVGGTVTTGLHLASLPALAAAPFFAVFVYVVAALWTRSDSLGRDGDPAGGTTPAG